MNIIPKIRIKKGARCKSQVPSNTYELIAEYSIGQGEKKIFRCFGSIVNDIVSDSFMECIEVVYLINTKMIDTIIAFPKLLAACQKMFGISSNDDIEKINLSSEVFYFDLDRKRYEASIIAEVTL